jgi:hypothetical protein
MVKEQKMISNIFPEVFLSGKDVASKIARGLKKGNVRKIGPRLYTTNLKDSAEYIIKKNLWVIVSLYFPDGLIADRTALENAPGKDGSVFLISKRERVVDLPGYTLKPRNGVPALDSDYPFIGNLKISSQARGMLENMRISREHSGKTSRTLSQKEIEERLENILVGGGEKALNTLREEARPLSISLHLENEFQKLEMLIGALLGTKEAKLESDVTISRTQGQPYDPRRVDLFQTLYADLKKMAPQNRLRLNPSDEAVTNLAFYEAYFSNFIEGTEFEVTEATDIIFNGRIFTERPEDAHDILGTYQIVSSMKEMSKSYANFDEFIHLLKVRHFQVMSSRQDKKPGEFKDKINRAGATTFVDPKLVTGTLLKGFELMRSLEAPFQRAVFAMFIIGEVHPFLDGNGRLSRIMMNCDLVRANEYPIIIPIIYRNNYLSALKALSHNSLCEPLIRTMDFAQKYVSSIDWSDFEIATAQLTRTNAFVDPHTADLEGIRLRIE